MSDEQAKPGDKIVITKDNEYNGLEFLVLECPDDRKDSVNHNRPWVSHEGGVYCLLNETDYKIVSRKSDISMTDVDKSLRNQMDNNLRSIFG